MAHSFKIESGIPVPEKLRPGRELGKSKYPFAHMQVGDSFFIATKQPKKVISSVGRIAADKFGKGGYATRRVEGGVRVWRRK